MRKHVPLAAALPAFLALWYLPSVGMVFWVRLVETGSGAWKLWSVLAFAAASVVFGAVAARARTSRPTAVLAGLPLAVLGGIGACSPEWAESVSGLLPSVAGSSAEGVTSQWMSVPLGSGGVYFLLGAALLTAALRPTRGRPAGRVRSALIGLAVTAFAWYWIIDLYGSEPWPRLLGLVGAGAVAGALAGASLPSRSGPFAPGLPLLGLGLWGILDMRGYEEFTYSAADFFSGGYELQEALGSIVETNLLVGGALVTAALVPWYRASRPDGAKAP